MSCPYAEGFDRCTNGAKHPYPFHVLASGKHVPMYDIAARYRAARAELEEATQAAMSAVRHDVSQGMTESEAARRYGITRMTVRAWLGKR